MNNNPWILLPTECQQNEVQFASLQPVNGLISGDQARPFFLKSGLPPNVLAQIWQLADISKDGKLDRLEFFIAMRLVRNCLSGLPLPPVLPESLKQLPMSSSIFSLGMTNASPPQLPQRPMSAYGGTLPANFGSTNVFLYSSTNASFSGQNTTTTTTTAPTFIMGIKELGDWSIPQHLKLRFSQYFNQLDRNRVGMLTGAQARGVLGESQLPTNVLAQIWTMSDVNKDGCLSIEEFCVAMHLIEMVKSGFALPEILPPELNLFCHRSKTSSPQVDPSMPPPQKNAPLKTFEDKRRDNLDRGQAELERRRKILREEEERRRAEIERKEREEEERRERERHELEKKREAEREAERLRELERERERAAEEERLKAEREEARKRLDQERIKELEKIRIRDLEAQYQNELEKTTQFQQRYKTMTFQLQAMEERSQSLNNEITDAHTEIVGVTSEIEKMRESRDQKLSRINDLQSKSQQLAVQCERLSHENLQLQSDCQKTFCKKQEIEKLKKVIVDRNDSINATDEELKSAKERFVNQEKLVNEKRIEFETCKEKLQKVLAIYNKLVDKFRLLKEQAEGRIKAKKKQSAEKQLSNAEDPSRFYSLPPADSNGNASILEQETFNVAKGFETNFEDNFSNAFPSSDSFGQDNASIVSSSSNPVLSTETAPKDSIANGVQTTTTVQSVGSKCNGSSGNVTVRYRALFEFIARSDDELSLQPGDVILVFEDHASEPGWLAGQIKEKVGWFPVAFAERIQKTDVKKVSISSNNATSPSAEPLESIKEETVGDKEFATDFSSAFGDSFTPLTTAVVPNTNDINGFCAMTKPVLTSSSVLYDAPPITTENVDNFAEKITEVGNEEEAIGVGTALYQWKARNNTELSFSRNDVIEVLEQTEMRWRGRLQKKPEQQGWFPKSYIKLSGENSSKNLTISKTPSVEKVPKSVQSPTTAITPLSSSSSQNKLSNNLAEKNGEGEWYIAMYQFDAVEPTDLSLKPGDMILVTEAKDEWWKGTCNKKTGIFPANYVQKASDLRNSGSASVGCAMAAYEATAPNQISLKVGDLVRIHNTSPGGWWEGEVERDGAKSAGWFPGNYVQVLSGDLATSFAAESLKKDGLATALFDYDAQRPDELSFKSGDVIEVVDQSDGQWWRGRKQGNESNPLLFPSNFVQPR